ncbi:type VI immunity family protein [Burkholderia cenocepacia]|uniref:type VI immunity family protein n=1 Tax=Burkholderia cenocepacia TaxID=95486 RepID=UPI002AB6D119|nr:type VI immunity family protein [Burkholderia cenocepacia]
MTDQALIDWAKAAQTHALIKSEFLDPDGEHDYIGAALVVRAALFFPDGYRPDVRAAIAECLRDYAAFAGDRLKWIAQDGRKPVKVKDGKIDESVLTKVPADQAATAYISSGETAKDAGLWEFRAFALPQWMETPTGGASTLTFSVPVPFIVTNPTAFQKLFVDCARRLRVYSGYAGYATNLSLTKRDENEPTEYWLSRRNLALDAGDPMIGAMHLREKIKTVGWLTAIDKQMVEKVGGISTLRNELPPDWFALYDVNGGLVIQAGPAPLPGDSSDGAGKGQPVAPASYVVLNAALKGVRAVTVSRLQRGVWGGPAPCYDTVPESDEWLRRFDVDEPELLLQKARLLKLPQLTDATELPDRLRG